MKMELTKLAAKRIGQQSNTMGNGFHGKFYFQPFRGMTLTRGKGLTPPPMQTEYAELLLTTLNKEVWLDGSWYVAWGDWSWASGDYQHLMWGFMDKDGDIQFVIDTNDPIHELIMTFEYRIECAAEGYNEWKEFMKTVDVKEHQKIKGSMGQRSIDPTAAPINPFSL